MVKKRYKLQISIVIGLMILIIISNSNAQVNVKDTQLHESRTFSKNQINVVQSNYLDKNGIPSYVEFLSKHGLDPQNITNEVNPYFSFSVSKSEVSEEDGELTLNSDAILLNLDFHVENIEEYQSINGG